MQCRDYAMPCLCDAVIMQYRAYAMPQLSNAANMRCRDHATLLYRDTARFLVLLRMTAAANDMVAVSYRAFAINFILTHARKLKLCEQCHSDNSFSSIDMDHQNGSNSQALLRYHYRPE